MFSILRSVIQKRLTSNSFIEDTKASLLIITETWLHSVMSDNEVITSDQNFIVYRPDRIGRKRGGLLIAIKNTLSSLLVFQGDNLELICMIT